MSSKAARKHQKKAPRPNSHAKRAIKLAEATNAYLVRQLGRQESDGEATTKHEDQATVARRLLEERRGLDDVSRSLILMILNLFPTCEPVMAGDIKLESRTSIATKQALLAFKQSRGSLTQNQIDYCCTVANHLLQQADRLPLYDEGRLAEVK